ncbi:aa3-type cytochrome c oxidase subunit IV [Cognatishimia activa]|uniref:Bacterial aa3 type cytochrome c oxidase subunit IV n=1 Tax=Cognatishimia activa TaxID=1715691 RepID=A0A0P1IRG6_9RHOB|nr:aa3-type cytochrome c oxidase subunit IV [Cognatishimia activa]MEE2944347.1 aa3-type cytochrome c oxidase subunit IV [Pseudomonadota bacterium]CUJ04243.1 Bacterial aa3 type cytochrome c oxidase subunit IV [Cognatishimia activa]CUK26079.1 Bacterial aa3 type cytochrome c oxidase subunit IV [Cognatishimia activa]
MAEHEHGTMNTDVQEQSFAGFIRVSTYVAGVSIAAIVLALAFFG